MRKIEQVFLTEEEQKWRNEVIVQLAKEAHIPIARAMMLTWDKLEGSRMETHSGREVQLSPMLTKAINRLPCSGRYVFSLNPFPPTIPDEILEPAIKRYKRRKLATAFHLL